MAVSILEIEELVASGINEKSLVAQLFEYTNSDDYLLKHKCYYILKEMASSFSLEFLAKENSLNSMLEEDVLRLLDIATKLKIDTPLIFKSLLYSKNPYLVRGEVMALAKNGSVVSLEKLLEFAISSKGRLIRRDLFSEVFGYMITINPALEKYIEGKKWENQKIRGYLRDMVLIGPKYSRLSVFPSNDYWALKARKQGLDYSVFKKTVEGEINIKVVKPF